MPPVRAAASYVIAVTAPAATTMTGYSQMIPPLAGPADPSFSVPTCPASASDAIGATAEYCEAQPSEYRAGHLRARAQRWHELLRASAARRQPAAGVEPDLQQPSAARSDIRRGIGISKTTPMLNVTRGQLVPYVITVDQSARRSCCRT